MENREMQITKKSKVIDIIFAVLYALLLLDVIIRFVKYSPANYLGLAIGTLLIMAFPAYIMIRTFKNKKTFRVFIKVPIYVVFMLVIVMFNIIGFGLVKETYFTIDSEDYERVMMLYDRSHDEMLSHFPENLPEDAEDIKFFCRGGFKFGGKDVQLLYKTTDENIDYYIEKYNPDGKVHEGNWVNYNWFENVDREYLHNGFIPVVLHEYEIEVSSRIVTNSSGFAYNRETKEIFFWYSDYNI